MPDATALEHIEITDNAVNIFFIFSPLYTLLFIINIVHNAKKKGTEVPSFSLIKLFYIIF